LRRALTADGQNAAMDVEARNGVHHRPGRHIDRHVGGSQLQCAGEAGKTAFKHQNGFGLKSPGREQHIEHDLAFGHETSLPSGKVALPYVQIGRDPRIPGIGDADGVHAACSRGIIGVGLQRRAFLRTRKGRCKFLNLRIVLSGNRTRVSGRCAGGVKSLPWPPGVPGACRSP
jgi:hypothetical protein